MYYAGYEEWGTQVSIHCIQIEERKPADTGSSFSDPQSAVITSQPGNGIFFKLKE